MARTRDNENIFAPNIYRPDLTTQVPLPPTRYGRVEPAAPAPENVARAGDRLLRVTPTGTETNFPTGREVGAVAAPGTVPQRVPLFTVPKPPIQPQGTPAPAPVVPPAQQAVGTPFTPRPFDAWTTDAELRKVAEQEVGVTAEKLSPLRIQQLALQSQESGARGKQAAEALAAYGETRTVGEIMGKPEEIREMEIAREAAGATMLPPSQRKLMQQDVERKFEVMKRERDVLAGQAESEFKETQYAASIQKAQLDVKRLGVDILNTIHEISAREDYNKQRMETLRQKTMLTEMEREELRTLEQGLTFTPPPAIAASDELLNAPDIKSMKSSVMDTALAGELYGIAQDTVRIINQGRMAASYENPLEMARDVTERPFEQGFVSLKGSDISPYRESARDALSAGKAPSEAFSEMLAETGISPDDTEAYDKAGAAIGAAIQEEYIKQAAEALRAAQTEIRAKQERVRAEVVTPELASLAETSKEPATAQQLMSDYFGQMENLRLQAEQLEARGGGFQQYAPIRRAQSFNVFNFRQKEDLTTEEIQSIVIASMIDKNKNNELAVAEFNRMLTKPTAQERLMLNLITSRLQVGYKNAAADYEKEVEAASVKRQAIVEKVKKDNPSVVVAFDRDETKTDYKVFPDQQTATRWTNASDAERTLIEAKAADDIKRVVAARDGNEAFQRLATKAQTEIRDFLNTMDMNLPDAMLEMKLFKDGWQFADLKEARATREQMITKWFTPLPSDKPITDQPIEYAELPKPTREQAITKIMAALIDPLVPAQNKVELQAMLQQYGATASKPVEPVAEAAPTPQAAPKRSPAGERKLELERRLQPFGNPIETWAKIAAQNPEWVQTLREEYGERADKMSDEQIMQEEAKRWVADMPKYDWSKFQTATGLSPSDVANAIDNVKDPTIILKGRYPEDVNPQHVYAWFLNGGWAQGIATEFGQQHRMNIYRNELRNLASRKDDKIRAAADQYIRNASDQEILNSWVALNVAKRGKDWWKAWFENERVRMDTYAKA